MLKSGKMTITAACIGPVWQKLVAEQVTRLLSLRIRSRIRRRSAPILEEPFPTPAVWEKQHHYQDVFRRAKDELLKNGRVEHRGELEAVGKALSLAQDGEVLESDVKFRAARLGRKLKVYRAGTVGIYPGALVKSGKDIFLYALVEDQVVEWKLSGTGNRMFLAPIVTTSYLQANPPPPLETPTAPVQTPSAPPRVPAASAPPARSRFDEALPFLVWLVLFTAIPAARRSAAGFRSAREGNVRTGPRAIKGAFIGAFKGFALGAALGMVGFLFLVVPASQKNFLTLLLVSLPATLAACLGALLAGFFASTGALLASSRLGPRATGLFTALCAAAGVGFFWMRLGHLAVP